jgi:hypothetical protein
LEAGSVPPSFNFSQLDFVEPSSGFHPVTWERVNDGGVVDVSWYHREDREIKEIGSNDYVLFCS